MASGKKKKKKSSPACRKNSRSFASNNNDNNNSNISHSNSDKNSIDACNDRERGKSKKDRREERKKKIDDMYIAFFKRYAYVEFGPDEDAQLDEQDSMMFTRIYQAWLNQSDEMKKMLLEKLKAVVPDKEEHDLDEEECYLKHFSRHVRDALHPSIHPAAKESYIKLPSDFVPPASLHHFDKESGSLSLDVCITSVKDNLANHKQFSDGLLQLVDQLELLMKAPSPICSQAHDIAVVLLSSEFLNRDVAMLEKKLEIEIEMIDDFYHKNGHDECPGCTIEDKHIANASAYCIILGLLAESEHVITERYQNTLPEPYQRMIRHQDKSSEELLRVRELFDDVAASYYLRCITIAFSPSIDSANGKAVKIKDDYSHMLECQDRICDVSCSKCQIRNSIAAMLLGGRYMRGGVEIAAILSDMKADQSPSLVREFNSQTLSNAHNREHALQSCKHIYQQAFQWTLQAALLDNPIAQHKVGYFYDEGLPYGVCDANVMEAVKWYSRAAKFLPDSMHNLANIYEDGRGELQADMKQAVTLYSVAAARGFPLSQLNLGRLFLLGEKNCVRRDRDAGRRLLTLAAESGNADAQMVIGTIHATPAFECFDLELSEYWLKSSLAGGKQEAEVLLRRVCQQLSDGQEGTDSTSDGVHCSKQMPIQNRSLQMQAAAAKQRGDDLVTHDLLHAAVLEFSRAFELNRRCLDYFVDRLETLYRLNHFNEFLSESHLLLDGVDLSDEDMALGWGDSDCSCSPEDLEKKRASNIAAMHRLFKIISKCLCSLHAKCCFDLGGSEDIGNYHFVKKTSAHGFLSHLQLQHCSEIIRNLLLESMRFDAMAVIKGDCDAGRDGEEAVKVLSFLVHMVLGDVRVKFLLIQNGGVPILLRLLSTICELCKTEDFFFPPRLCPQVDGNATLQEIGMRLNPLNKIFTSCVDLLAFLVVPMTREEALQQHKEDRHKLDHTAQIRKILANLLFFTDGYSTLSNCASVCLHAVTRSVVHYFSHQDKQLTLPQWGQFIGIDCGILCISLCCLVQVLWSCLCLCALVSLLMQVFYNCWLVKPPLSREVPLQVCAEVFTQGMLSLALTLQAELSILLMELTSPGPLISSGSQGSHGPGDEVNDSFCFLESEEGAKDVRRLDQLLQVLGTVFVHIFQTMGCGEHMLQSVSCPSSWVQAVFPLLLLLQVISSGDGDPGRQQHSSSDSSGGNNNCSSGSSGHYTTDQMLDKVMERMEGVSWSPEVVSCCRALGEMSSVEDTSELLAAILLLAREGSGSTCGSAGANSGGDSGLSVLFRDLFPSVYCPDSGCGEDTDEGGEQAKLEKKLQKTVLELERLRREVKSQLVSCLSILVDDENLGVFLSSPKNIALYCKRVVEGIRETCGQR